MLECSQTIDYAGMTPSLASRCSSVKFVDPMENVSFFSIAGPVITLQHGLVPGLKGIELIFKKFIGVLKCTAVNLVRFVRSPMSSFAEYLGVDGSTRPLKIGKSFSRSETPYHTVRCKYLVQLIFGAKYGK